MVLEGEDVGCEDLYKAIRRVMPKINAFGHIHEGYGTTEDDGVLYINCSVLDRRYAIRNKPIEVIYLDGEFSVYRIATEGN
jgi:Icc-related predicted phosphoesterase